MSDPPGSLPIFGHPALIDFQAAQDRQHHQDRAMGKRGQIGENRRLDLPAGDAAFELLRKCGQDRGAQPRRTQCLTLLCKREIARQN